MPTPKADTTVPPDKSNEPEKAQGAVSPPEAAPKHRHGCHARFEQAVLLLQGGGALGSYQAGVYQALAEAHLHPDWVAGISIGAVNSALIVGNPPEKRVERLREFWEAVSTSPLGVPYFSSIGIPDDSTIRCSTRPVRSASCCLARQISSRPGFRRRCRGKSAVPTR